jgi:hypothetical protein
MQRILSVDTPLTALMRGPIVSAGGVLTTIWTYARLFQNVSNLIGIPQNLFANIDTSAYTDCRWMFQHTFSDAAQNSTTATIPQGLFSAVDTSQCTLFAAVMQNTFSNFAPNSVSGTIPADLLDFLDTRRATSFGSVPFNETFTGYATRTATFKVSGAVVDAQEFASPYAIKNITTP